MAGPQKRRAYRNKERGWRGANSLSGMKRRVSRHEREFPLAASDGHPDESLLDATMAAKEWLKTALSE